MRVQLKGKQIPHRTDGYPAFSRLGDKWMQGAEGGQYKDDRPDSLLAVFTADEVVELVNRAIYQMEYQATAHGKRQQRERESVAPIKEMLKRLFPGTSWLRATDDQIKAATERVAAERATKEGK